MSGCETVHGELQTQGLSGEGVPYVGGSEGFSVQEIHDVSKVHGVWKFPNWSCFIQDKFENVYILVPASI